ncbi:MAG: hypothetical protein AUI01_01035 [Ktedonobacter sp. 13_2_20CM_2_56_8]|nr:MAG: hypothetical protein AUI01_01035 [Ktedonobacter sp. 13_2_20CM_2_56_8]
MASTLLREQVALRKLIWVGPLTIVFTVIVNLLIRSIAVSIFGVPETFQYLQAPYVIGSTIVFLLVALTRPLSSVEAASCIIAQCAFYGLCYSLVIVV